MVSGSIPDLLVLKESSTSAKTVTSSEDLVLQDEIKPVNTRTKAKFLIGLILAF